jgi:hypothetical protein
MNIFNTIDNLITMSLDFVSAPVYSNNKPVFRVTKFFGKGNCCFKNKKRESCPRKNTFYIHELGQCVCGYHLSNYEDVVSNLIEFYKKYKILYKNIFSYTYCKEYYIENLKDILYLLIVYKKERHILVNIFDMVLSQIPNFDIKDKEYLKLVSIFYKTIL